MCGVLRGYRGNRMTEVECPYCGNEFEDENFEQDYLSDIEAECPRCEKNFLYNIFISTHAENVRKVIE